MRSSVDLWLANNLNRASQLRFYEPNATVGAFPPVGINYSAFVQNDPLATDITYDLPPTLNTAAVNQQQFMRATTTTASIAAQLDWVDASTIVGQSGWLLTGNASTNPVTNFLGTTDAQARQTDRTSRTPTQFELGIQSSIPPDNGRRVIQTLCASPSAAVVVV
ncbi:MAG: hypothetical protein KDD67_17975 [Ignavibacteriae bacterium]|nr:hypothetical protein [Ignavibacteriota bacterium]MCB9214598.1 hypothetical protein [Ignavibacteria bacterium]